jgi:hypothetical protein
VIWTCDSGRVRFTAGQEYEKPKGGNLPAAQALGMATVHFADEAAGIAEISRLLGLP